MLAGFVPLGLASWLACTVISGYFSQCHAESVAMVSIAR